MLAVWGREITIPAAVFAALLIAGSPINNLFSLAAGDVTPAAATVALASAPPDEVAVPEAAAEADTPPASPANQTVVASLEVPEVKLDKPSPDAMTPPDIVAGPNSAEVYDANKEVEIVDECLILEICVDRYLWQRYQATPKEDSVKESVEKQVTVKRKGKTVTVTRKSSIVVDEDFGWKDPHAAETAGMSLSDYVIGGIDRDFKLRLFQMLRAAEVAGLVPGITSGFRDDYRQSIASGLKAASNRSFHGGSLRGGYGHGLAADIVSLKGATRAERLGNSHRLWKWVDEHGSEFGIGRPYLNRDPPHVAPTDGEEFARHRPNKKLRQVASRRH